MAPRTPKDPEKKPAKAKPAKAKPAAEKPAAKAAARAEARPAKAALKLVEKPAPAASKAGSIKLKDLVGQVASATGAKTADTKRAVEATLAAIGGALAAGKALTLPPLGKLRVVKTKDTALTLKLRLTDAPKAAGLALADDKEDD
jgi:hypothetical protein